jgi:hypothetical protein
MMSTGGGGGGLFLAFRQVEANLATEALWVALATLVVVAAAWRVYLEIQTDREWLRRYRVAANRCHRACCPLAVSTGWIARGGGS